MQILPAASLVHLIKHYLVLENEATQKLNLRIFADGNPGIVFYSSQPLWQCHQNENCIHPQSFLYGQITRYQNLSSAGSLKMLVVVLQPYAIYALTKMPVAQLNDIQLDLKYLFGQQGTDLEDQVLNTPHYQAKIEHIEKFFIQKMRLFVQTDLLVPHTINLIALHKGIISVEALLKELPVTEKQLERKFKTQVGIGPKKFCGIIKMSNFLKLLRQRPATAKIGDLYYEGGYYDQPHMNNYFKKSAGLTPQQYAGNSNALALNFLQTTAGL
jgi:AraC-like DNA-binding protein